MTSAIRMAVLSLDHWYNAFPFVDSCREAPGVELVGIAHGDAAQGAPVAERAGVPFFADYRDLLRRDDVDAVGIFASTEKMAEMSTAAAKAGKHIIAIKPMAMNLAEADQVVEAVESAGVRYLPSDGSYRLVHLALKIKEWIEQGRIGEPLNIFFAGRASVPRRWYDDATRGWWTDAQRTVGGGWIDHAIYQVDFLRYVLGTEFTSARGFTANLKYKDIDGLEDYGIATFTTKRGTVINIEDTWTQPGAGLQQLYQIIGSKGAIMVDTAAQQMRLTGEFDSLAGQWVTLTPPMGRTSLVTHLVDSLQSATPTVAGVRDARTNLAVCLAFYEAARTGQTVSLR